MTVMSRFLACLGVALVSSQNIASFEDLLVIDDACDVKAEGDGCDLSLRQLRGVIHAHDHELRQKPDDDIMGSMSASKEYPTYPGFSLKLVEEFDEPIDLDSNPIWTWSDGGLTEGQVRFAKEQVRFGNGTMQIVVEPNPGISLQACSRAEKAVVYPKPLVSGEFRTRYNQFRYGRYEVRMKAPQVQPGNPDIPGNFITTMFVYKDAMFRHWREIDFEVTGDSPTSVTTNVLSANGLAAWQPGIQDAQEVHITGNARADFHTYAFEWLPDSITWFIDGVQVRRQSGGAIPIPEHPGKIMMNTWIFGPLANFGGKQIHNNRYPMTAEYDWFRFYKWDGDKLYPCPGLSTSCLSEDDLYLSANNPCDGQEQTGLKFGQPPCQVSCPLNLRRTAH